MTEYTLDQIKTLWGPKIPTFASLPAAWWISTDPEQLSLYDQWKVDYEARRDKVKELAEKLGLDLDAAYSWSGDTDGQLSGFASPHEMRLWSGHPNHQPPPEGWRVDKKTDYLVPKRKTKVDRESQANKDFAAVRKIPNVRGYVTGLPTMAWLPGSIYYTNYLRGYSAVIAYSYGDPDRVDHQRDRQDWKAAEATGVWQRQPLSTLQLVREDQAKTKKENDDDSDD